MGETACPQQYKALSSSMSYKVCRRAEEGGAGVGGGLESGRSYLRGYSEFKDQHHDPNEVLEEVIKNEMTLFPIIRFIYK